MRSIARCIVRAGRRHVESIAERGLVSLVNFGIHAVMTGLIIVVTRHIAGRTDDLHVFMRVTALLTVTVIALTWRMLSRSRSGRCS